MIIKSLYVASLLALLAVPASAQSVRDFAVAAREVSRANRSAVSAVQQELAAQGYYNGAIDGIWGRGTHSAITALIGDLNAGAIDSRADVATEGGSRTIAGPSASVGPMGSISSAGNPGVFNTASEVISVTAGIAAGSASNIGRHATGVGTSSASVASAASGRASSGSMGEVSGATADSPSANISSAPSAVSGGGFNSASSLDSSAQSMADSIAARN